jgi:hypothetical protein
VSSTRTIRIENSGATRTVVRNNGPAGLAGPAGPAGSMTGPGSATADAIALFNGSTGSVLKNSNVLLSALATAAALASGLAGKQDKVTGKGLSEQDFTTVLKAKLDALGTATYRGSYTTLANLEAAVPAGNAGDYAHVQVLGTDLKVYHWDSTNGVWQPGVDLSGKVDKVAGKGLSKNDFTDAYLAMLSTAVQTTTLDAEIAALTPVLDDIAAHIESPFDPHPSTFAGIGLDLGTTQQTIANNTVTALTAFSTSPGFNESSNDAVSNKTDNRVEITRTGRYKIDWSLSVSAGSNNVQLYAGILKGGTLAASGQAATKLAAISDVHFLGGTAVLDVASVAGTDGHLKMAVWHGHGGSVDVTPVYAGLVAVRLGDSP